MSEKRWLKGEKGLYIRIPSRKRLAEARAYWKVAPKRSNSMRRRTS